MKYTKLINKKEFDTLTKTEKIKAICQDVIDRLKAKNIIASTGNFLSYTYKVDKNTINSFNNSNEYCEVCAKGALFCAWVGNFNEFSGVASFNNRFTEYEDFDFSKIPGLLEIFGQKLLDKIEIAFELNQKLAWIYDLDMEEKDNLVDYFENFDVDHERLIAIMEHLVDNDGKFNV